MSERKKVGIIDSGIGGLSLVNQLIQYDIDIYYYADTKNMPYGDKSSSELLQYSEYIINLFEQYKITEIIIACFTLCSTVYDQLIALYPHISFIEIVSLVVKQSVNVTQNNTILVLATPATIASGIFCNKFKQFPHITLIEKSCPTLAKIIENSNFNDVKIKKIIKKLYPVTNSKLQHPDTIILGCTHYTFISTELYHYFNKKIALIYAQPPFHRYQKKSHFKQSNLYYIVSGDHNSFHQKLKCIVPNYFLHNIS